MTPSISIVMGYFNRKPQLLFTLATIAKSVVKDEIEVIIVDDGSSDDHILSQDDLDFPFTIRVFRIDPKSKTWINPVIPYNLGISKAQGEWIILQNPEVCHVGDVCAYVSSADQSLYHVMRVWALDKTVPKEVYQPVLLGNNPFPHAFLMCRRSWKGGWGGSWYTRLKHPERAFHFCSAIHRSVLSKIGGFNPVMADGCWYDDNELLCRIRRVSSVHFPLKHVMGIHQWHPRFSDSLASRIPKSQQLALRRQNKAILKKVRANSSFVHVSIESRLPPPSSYTTITNKP